MAWGSLPSSPPSPGPRLSWCCCRQASTSPRGTGAVRQHQGGAGERPPFSTLRARPNEHPSFCCARESSWLLLTMSSHQAGFRRQLATAGPLPFKAKEVVFMQTKHETVLVQRRALQAPKVMLDDAVQARPGRLRPNNSEEPPRWQFHYGQQRERPTGRRL